MKRKWFVASTGFALFSMFFGSGNLVFPILVGQESGGHALYAALGIILTGVLVPFLGIYAMMLHDGDVGSFFRCFGKYGTFLLSLVVLGLMGPFGVLARCLTVMHGALEMLIPDLSLPVASFLFCVAIFSFAINRRRILSTLGTWLTPVLLVLLALIAFFGLRDNPLPQGGEVWGFTAFTQGFFQGYQLMDLLAAFFFSSFVIQQLKANGTSLQVFLKASGIGMGILSCVYLVLVVLGAMYAPLLVDSAPQERLGIIATSALGPYAAPCVSITMLLACLTTAIALTTLFADFLRKEVTKEKMNTSVALGITLAIGFLVSTLEFSGIARFLSPILEMLYPALIALALANIVQKLWHVQLSHWPVTVAVFAKVLTI